MQFLAHRLPRINLFHPVPFFRLFSLRDILSGSSSLSLLLYADLNHIGLHVFRLSPLVPSDPSSLVRQE